MNPDETVQGRSPREIANLKKFTADDVVAGYARWETISPVESRVLAEVLAGGAALVLDLGCGAGRVAAAAVGRCAFYLGVDVSSEMLTVARSKVPEAEFVQADFFEFQDQRAFTTVLLMHNTIDSVHPLMRRRWLLRRARAFLHPGGTIVISTHTLLEGRDASVEGLRMMRRSELLLRHAWSRVRGFGYVPQMYHGRWVYQYRSSTDHVVDELRNAGFEVDGCFPDWSRGRPDWNYYIARAV